MVAGFPFEQVMQVTVPKIAMPFMTASEAISLLLYFIGLAAQPSFNREETLHKHWYQEVSVLEDSFGGWLPQLRKKTYSHTKSAMMEIYHRDLLVAAQPCQERRK